MPDDRIKLLFSKDEINKTISRLASEISRDYADKSPLIIGILKGSFMLISDLIRALKIPVEVDFVRLSSYGGGKESSGEVKVVYGLEVPLENRHVLVVEDIIDSGLTLNFFLEDLRKRNPASLRLCTLIDKTYRRKTHVPIDYVGFLVEKGFVVGYGIDYNEKYRHLPEIYTIEGS